MKTKLLTICLFLVTLQVFAEKKDIGNKEIYQSGYKNNGNGWTNYYQQDFKKQKSFEKEENKIIEKKKDE
jgi:hypothetical protein